MNYLIVAAGLILGVLVLYYFLRFLKLSYSIRKIEMRNFAINLIAIIVIFVFNVVYLKVFFHVQEFRIYILVNLVLIIAFLALSILNLRTYLKMDNIYQDVKLNKYYNKLLSSFTEELRRIKHNYNNIVSVITGYAGMKKWDKLSDYINDLEEDFKDVKKLSPLMFGNINNVALLVLFIEKIKMFSEKGGEISVDCQLPLAEINAKMHVLCGVLGVVLDNEISIKALEDKKDIPVKIFRKDRDLIFQIETSGNLDYLNKVSEISRNEKWMRYDLTTKGNANVFNLAVKDWEVKVPIRDAGGLGK